MTENHGATVVEPAHQSIPHDPARKKLQSLLGLVRAARPHQWIKNLACFAGLIFSGKLTDLAAIGPACLAFFGFCLTSSAVYLINDVFDRDSDRRNPLKCRRPIASGVVSVSWAIGMAVVLLYCAGLVGASLPPGGLAVLITYAALGVAYSARLKQVVLLDVMIIAMGFVLRVLLGVYAVRVKPSPWIVLCVFFLALFLGFAKRRAEMVRLGDARTDLRAVLARYSVGYLDQLQSMTAVLAILSYALYTVLGRQNDGSLVVTVPLVVFGIFHYLQRVVVDGLGETPEWHLMRDPILLFVSGLWLALCLSILYGNVILFQA